MYTPTHPQALFYALLSPRELLGLLVVLVLLLAVVVYRTAVELKRYNHAVSPEDDHHEDSQKHPCGY